LLCFLELHSPKIRDTATIATTTVTAIVTTLAITTVIMIEIAIVTPRAAGLQDGTKGRRRDGGTPTCPPAKPKRTGAMMTTETGPSHTTATGTQIAARQIIEPQIIARQLGITSHKRP
jgi:hypothetical protein